MSGICAGIALHIMIKNTLNRLRREIQACGFFFVSEQAPGVNLCRSLVRIFLADADGTGTQMLKKEKKGEKDGNAILYRLIRTVSSDGRAAG